MDLLNLRFGGHSLRQYQKKHLEVAVFAQHFAPNSFEQNKHR